MLETERADGPGVSAAGTLHSTWLGENHVASETVTPNLHARPLPAKKFAPRTTTRAPGVDADTMLRMSRRTGLEKNS